MSKKGRGHYTTIRDALGSIPVQSYGQRVVVYVKAGVYEEYISIRRNDVTLLGDGIGNTIIRSSRSDTTHDTIMTSAALNALGGGFIAIGISFENVAGAENGRGVALHSAGDKSAFFRCSFSGYQDTLFVHRGRQFFRECIIEGTIDFIFGDASAVFQRCTIKVRKPMEGQRDVIVAQGRTEPEPRGRTGIVIQGCMLTRAAGFYGRGYLGRPWKRFSRTVIMQSFIDDFVDPSGWINMPDNPAVDDLVFREMSNHGPGVGTSGRIQWPGYQVMDLFEARKYTVARFIGGLKWLPSTRIPFSPFL